MMDWSPRSRTSNRCSRSGGSQQSSSLSLLQRAALTIARSMFSPDG